MGNWARELLFQTENEGDDPANDLRLYDHSSLLIIPLNTFQKRNKRWERRWVRAREGGREGVNPDPAL